MNLFAIAAGATDQAAFGAANGTVFAPQHQVMNHDDRASTQQPASCPSA
ncbi:MAG: hypothetical protein JZU60_00065 [Ilumatobacteraceae bacterium]|nr:hypothetical protein [Ilumatobacteraceae bacterium]